MINKITEQSLNDIINLVKERKIKSIKITKQESSYYVEYEECEEPNESEQMVELLMHLEEFSNGLNTNTINSFYLYYNVVIDIIIININKTNEEAIIQDVKEIDPIVSVLNNLIKINKTLDKTNLEKITLTEGKKKFNTTYSKIINKLIEEIKNILE